MTGSSRLILLAGPPGAGKSAVARLLVAASETPMAYLEGDTFWQFIATRRSAATRAEARMDDARIVVQAMIAAALRYARGGYETLVDFTIGPWALPRIRAAMKGTPFHYVVLCPSEAVCAERAARRLEGTMADYAPFRELHAAFGTLGAFERHAIRSDTADAAALAARIRAGLDGGAFLVEAVE